MPVVFLLFFIESMGWSLFIPGGALLLGIAGPRDAGGSCWPPTCSGTSCASEVMGLEWVLALGVSGANLRSKRRWNEVEVREGSGRL